jgi:hypothetical protein
MWRSLSERLKFASRCFAASGNGSSWRRQVRRVWEFSFSGPMGRPGRVSRRATRPTAKAVDCSAHHRKQLGHLFRLEQDHRGAFPQAAGQLARDKSRIKAGVLACQEDAVSYHVIAPQRRMMRQQGLPSAEPRSARRPHCMGHQDLPGDFDPPAASSKPNGVFMVDFVDKEILAEGSDLPPRIQVQKRARCDHDPRVGHSRSWRKQCPAARRLEIDTDQTDAIAIGQRPPFARHAGNEIVGWYRVLIKCHHP